MGTEAKLNAELRTETGKGVARKLRQAGKLPAVLYGAGKDAQPLTLDGHDTHLLFQAIAVENTIIQLQLDGEGAPVPTLVREVQAHPFRPEILHVDFLRVEKGVEVELTVPFVLVGNPKGVREDGGVLDQLVHELPVRCIPSAIPENLSLDVSEMVIGDSKQLDSLDVPEGVTVTLDTNITLCAVHAPRVAEDAEISDEAEAPALIGEETAEAEASEGDEG
jgi:large subunit ribosomal protein L25